uniref:Uncharacterized protein n=1 Tax=Rhizophora mucronata TaxID=61149 RepID=A0A2P2JYV7_RHIMU
MPILRYNQSIKKCFCFNHFNFYLCAFTVVALALECRALIILTDRGRSKENERDWVEVINLPGLISDRSSKVKKLRSVLSVLAFCGFSFSRERKMVPGKQLPCVL